MFLVCLKYTLYHEKDMLTIRYIKMIKQIANHFQLSGPIGLSEIG